MHPKVFQAFANICNNRSVGESILEIGAVPAEDCLLNMRPLRNVTRKVGVNLDGPHEFNDFLIEQGNGNSLRFADDTFDTVLCNATLEHDKFFWKTLSEIRRVAKPGGLVVIGVPGFAHYRIEHLRYYLLKSKLLRRLVATTVPANLVTSTLTLQIHGGPGDYYRFSEQALREVFFEGMREVETLSIMAPPRLIGAGQLPPVPRPVPESGPKNAVG